ncbi:MAG: 50S ribosomal protein L22 [Chloroflexi bacterium]|nr:50S ribosomal protein L22 [Chloroflexota bacterium]
MAVKATAKNTGVSVRKMKLIVDLVRGRRVEKALETLQFLPSPAAEQVARVLKSAAANAENELLARTSDLRIVEIYANEAPRTKRFRARARGRAAKVIRRNSHITVVVDEEETE